MLKLGVMKSCGCEMYRKAHSANTVYDSKSASKRTVYQGALRFVTLYAVTSQTHHPICVDGVLDYQKNIITTATRHYLNDHSMLDHRELKDIAPCTDTSPLPHSPPLLKLNAPPQHLLRFINLPTFLIRPC